MFSCFSSPHRDVIEAESGSQLGEREREARVVCQHRRNSSQEGLFSEGAIASFHRERLLNSRLLLLIYCSRAFRGSSPLRMAPKRLRSGTTMRSGSVSLQVILSPAKTQNFEPHAVADSLGAAREPVGLARTNELAALLAKQSVSQLRSTLGVSEKIASENYKRFASWASAPKRQAIVAYDGMVYDKLRGRDMSATELAIAQKRLIILSGLWGAVRALDWIKPYRLEMACKKLKQYPNLSSMWREAATEEVLSGFVNSGERVLINVASDESASAVDFDKLSSKGVTVVKADFRDATGKRQPTVHLKHARGLLARYVITNDVDEVGSLESFDLEDYVYDDGCSSAEVMVFKKKSTGATAAPTKRAKKSAS